MVFGEDADCLCKVHYGHISWCVYKSYIVVWAFVFFLGTVTNIVVSDIILKDHTYLHTLGLQGFIIIE